MLYLGCFILVGSVPWSKNIKHVENVYLHPQHWFQLASLKFLPLCESFLLVLEAHTYFHVLLTIFWKYRKIWLINFLIWVNFDYYMQKSLVDAPIFLLLIVSEMIIRYQLTVKNAVATPRSKRTFWHLWCQNWSILSFVLKVSWEIDL